MFEERIAHMDSVERRMLSIDAPFSVPIRDLQKFKAAFKPYRHFTLRLIPLNTCCEHHAECNCTQYTEQIANIGWSQSDYMRDMQWSYKYFAENEPGVTFKRKPQLSVGFEY